MGFVVWARSDFATSRPDILGMFTSSRTKSGLVSSAIFRAVSPDEASATS